jgi:nucleotide-binding universal stress UspA family protein
MQEFLLVLEATEGASDRAKIAAAFAATHRATLRALILQPLLREDRGLEALLESRITELRKRATDLQSRLQSVSGIPAALIEASPDRVIVDMASAMRGADLVICAPPKLDRSSSDDDIFEAALFVSGRPVLLIPESITAPISTASITIAWKECREATRALYDSMPLLARAEKVTLLGVSDDESGALIARHSLERAERILVRHGVKSTLKAIVEEGGVPKTVAREAATSDLLVMGGYGHWRWSQILFGGVTRYMLQNMTMPVLMAR